LPKNTAPRIDAVVLRLDLLHQANVGRPDERLCKRKKESKLTALEVAANASLAAGMSGAQRLHLDEQNCEMYPNAAARL
jgi:hypothetical protein